MIERIAMGPKIKIPKLVVIQNQNKIENDTRTLDHKEISATQISSQHSKDQM